ncbi:hypothetical protein XENORESO_022037 [Xenotaenia resolanae]|uniref:Uncharacterized protein n=1 Tax=Xenotaenia resolanae TaxID=208358 RepID=A0ABV0WCZ3_9TELE
MVAYFPTYSYGDAEEKSFKCPGLMIRISVTQFSDSRTLWTVKRWWWWGTLQDMQQTKTHLCCSAGEEEAVLALMWRAAVPVTHTEFLC